MSAPSRASADLETIRLLLAHQGQRQAVVFLSALTADEWDDVLRLVPVAELLAFRRLRKLAMHRVWRLRHLDAERERHRRNYQDRKAS